MPKLYTILQNLNEEDSITQVKLFSKYIKEKFLNDPDSCIGNFTPDLDQLMKVYAVDNRVRVKDTVKQQYVDIIEKCL